MEKRGIKDLNPSIFVFFTGRFPKFKPKVKKAYEEDIQLYHFKVLVKGSIVKKYLLVSESLYFDFKHIYLYRILVKSSFVKILSFLGKDTS